MFNLIPLPYRILAAVLAFILWSGFMIAGGWKECSIREQAKQKDQALAYAEAMKTEQARGNALSADLAAAEASIQAKILERSKHVPQVTIGRDCLSAGAVSLLNDSVGSNLPAAAGQPAVESRAAPAATDTDVEYWAIAASGSYDTCAERLNSLIDFEMGRKT